MGMLIRKLPIIYYQFIVLTSSFLLLRQVSLSQTISVFPVQDLSFGAFFQGSAGGTVSMSSDGSRGVTGDLVLANLGYLYFPAIFEVEAPSGSVLSILNGPDVVLTGSNGGSMTLHLGTSDHGGSFTTSVSPPQRTAVSFGGTLTVGDKLSNPSGNYSGTFSVTFIQE